MYRKGAKTRIIPIIDEGFLSDLIHHIGHCKEGPVFLSNQNKALSPRIVNHIVELTGTRAGIDNPNPRLQHLNPHIFRHSIAQKSKSVQLSPKTTPSL